MPPLFLPAAVRQPVAPLRGYQAATLNRLSVIRCKDRFVAALDGQTIRPVSSLTIRSRPEATALTFSTAGNPQLAASTHTSHLVARHGMLRLDIDVIFVEEHDDKTSPLGVPITIDKLL